ncbi:MAG: ankyrin repeat domain-containing protein [Chlamydiota bacterium]
MSVYEISSQLFNVRSSTGNTPLHNACYYKDMLTVTQIVQTLIQNEDKAASRAFILSRNNDGFAAMDLVILDPSTEGQQILGLLQDALSVLPERPATRSLAAGPRLQIRACASPTVRSLSALYGPPSDESSSSISSSRQVQAPIPRSLPSATPLIFQALIARDETLLFERIVLGEDVNCLYEGQTPLTIAIYQENLGAVIILLEAPGIDLSRVNAMGQTPLDVALLKGNSEILEFLLD